MYELTLRRLKGWIPLLLSLLWCKLPAAAEQSPRNKVSSIDEGLLEHAVVRITRTDGGGTGFFLDGTGIEGLGVNPNTVMTARHVIPFPFEWEKFRKDGEPFVARKIDEEVPLPGVTAETLAPVPGSRPSVEGKEGTDSRRLVKDVRLKFLPSAQIISLGADMALLSLYGPDGKPVSAPSRLALSDKTPSPGLEIWGAGFPKDIYYGVKTVSAFDLENAEEDAAREYRLVVKALLEEVQADPKGISKEDIASLPLVLKQIRGNIEDTEHDNALAIKTRDDLANLHNILAAQIEKHLSPTKRRQYVSLLEEEARLFSAMAEHARNNLWFHQVVWGWRGYGLAQVLTRLAQHEDEKMRDHAIGGELVYGGDDTPSIDRITSLTALVDHIKKDPVHGKSIRAVQQGRSTKAFVLDVLDRSRLARVSLRGNEEEIEELVNGNRSWIHSDPLIEVIRTAIAWHNDATKADENHEKEAKRVLTERIGIVHSLPGRVFDGSYAELKGRISKVVQTNEIHPDDEGDLWSLVKLGGRRYDLYQKLAGSEHSAGFPLFFESHDGIYGIPGLSGGPSIDRDHKVLGMHKSMGNSMSDQGSMSMSCITSTFLRRVLALKGTLKHVNLPSKR